jgi:hypothetical protein
MTSEAASVRPVGGTSLDEVPWGETEARGYLPATLSDGRREIDVVFYDPTRLAQDIEAEVRSRARFASPPIVVVPSVTRSAVEEAAQALADQGFSAVTRW